MKSVIYALVLLLGGGIGGYCMHSTQERGTQEKPCEQSGGKCCCSAKPEEAEAVVTSQTEVAAAVRCARCGTACRCGAICRCPR